MIINRPANMMAGVVKSDLWNGYATMPGLASANKGSFRNVRNDSWKFTPSPFSMRTTGASEAMWKYAQTNPVMLGSLLQQESKAFTTQNPTLLAGMGDATTDATDPAALDLGKLIQQGVIAWNTQTIANANAERIAHGLPPLDPSAYAPQVNVGMSSQTIMMIALAAAAVLFLVAKR